MSRKGSHRKRCLHLRVRPRHTKVMVDLSNNISWKNTKKLPKDKKSNRGRRNPPIYIKELKASPYPYIMDKQLRQAVTTSRERELYTKGGRYTCTHYHTPRRKNIFIKTSMMEYNGYSNIMSDNWIRQRKPYHTGKYGWFWCGDWNKVIL